jgi:hypothetical protein
MRGEATPRCHDQGSHRRSLEKSQGCQRQALPPPPAAAEPQVPLLLQATSRRRRGSRTPTAGRASRRSPQTQRREGRRQRRAQALWPLLHGRSTEEGAGATRRAARLTSGPQRSGQSGLPHLPSHSRPPRVPQPRRMKTEWQRLQLLLLRTPPLRRYIITCCCPAESCQLITPVGAPPPLCVESGAPALPTAPPASEPAGVDILSGAPGNAAALETGPKMGDASMSSPLVLPLLVALPRLIPVDDAAVSPMRLLPAERCAAGGGADIPPPLELPPTATGARCSGGSMRGWSGASAVLSLR